MGQLPPVHRRQGDLQSRRPHPLVPDLELATTPPPVKILWLDQKDVFPEDQSRDWIFKGSTGGTLYHASSTPIRRHVKVKSAAHPFDPQWMDYFRIQKDFLKLKGAGENLSFFLMGQAIGQVS